jgi:hypothetical protein
LAKSRALFFEGEATAKSSASAQGLRASAWIVEMNWEPMRPMRTLRFMLSSFEFPAFAVFVVEEVVGFTVVGEFEVFAVPIQFLTAITNAERAEEDGLGERAGEVEVRTSWRAFLAGFEPFFVMADGTRQGRRGPFVFLIAALGNKAGMFATPAGDEHFAFVADENDAVFGIELAFVFFQFIGSSGKNAAVVPMKFNGRQVAASGKLIMDGGRNGHSFFEDGSGTGVDTFRRAEIQRGKDGREIVDAHVAEPAGAEVPPTAPFEWRVSRVIGAEGRGAEPEVPIQSGGYGRRVGRTLNTLGPPERVFALVSWSIGPDVDFADCANCAIGKPFVDLAIAFEGHALIAHLSGDLGFASGFGDDASLVDGAGERLFAINVLAHFDGGHRDKSVIVIRSTADDRVDALFFVEHFAKVFVAFGVGIALEGFGGVIPIDVSKRDDVFLFDRFDVPTALSADADAGNVQFGIRGWAAAAEDVRFDDHEGRGGSAGCGDEFAARKSLHRFSIFDFRFSIWKEATAARSQNTNTLGWRCKNDAGKRVVTRDSSVRFRIERFFEPFTRSRIMREARISAMPSESPRFGLRFNVASIACF